jgi:2-methylcitrate dehydratase PrpD
MEKVTEKLAEFATQLQFSDLPKEVVHEMKRVTMDSIGCAIGGLSTDRGRIALELAKKPSGPGESSIIGTNWKVSCVNAAFANGELTNAQDFDAFSRAHDAPIIIPATLAPAECTSASGKSLILAIVLGFEISYRLKLATVSGRTGLIPITEGPDKGKVLWPPVRGHSTVSLAAAVGASKIINLNQEQTANALGIAGCLCPPNIFTKWTDTAPVKMTKYGSSGWGAQVGVTSALLAQMGYTGDIDLFDGEYCFWRYTGSEDWKNERVLQDLGKEWHCHKISYKKYPCGY